MVQREALLKPSFSKDRANAEFNRYKGTKSQVSASLERGIACIKTIPYLQSTCPDLMLRICPSPILPYSVFIQPGVNPPVPAHPQCILGTWHRPLSINSAIPSPFISTPQNLNLGPTKTNKNAAIHNPAIIAYNLILPHQPLPSVILLKVLILFPAASIPILFLSKPVSARLNTSFSFSNELANCIDDCFRLFASVTRDVVRRS